MDRIRYRETTALTAVVLPNAIFRRGAPFQEEEEPYPPPPELSRPEPELLVFRIISIIFSQIPDWKPTRELLSRYNFTARIIGEEVQTQMQQRWGGKDTR